MIKKVFVVILTSFVQCGVHALFCQNVSYLPSSYDRISLTVFYLENPLSSDTKKYVEKVVYSDKYDNNNFDSPFLWVNFNNEGGGYKDQILNELNKSGVGKKIISKWYMRKPDGTMSTDLIHQRGRYTTTDEEYEIAHGSARAGAALEDYGHELINLSYVMVINIAELKRKEDENRITWEAGVFGYIYKIDYSEEHKKAVYESWINEDDSKDVRMTKNRKYESIFVPLTHVLTISTTKSRYTNKVQTGSEENIRKRNQQNERAIFQALIQDTYDECIHYAEVANPNFKTTVSLYSTRPPKAKIGLKEGLKIDDRYFVYEHTVDEKTGKIVAKRRGVIRSTKRIVDNRQETSGSTQLTKFYQVAGRRLKPGYVLRQENDFGGEFALTYENGAIGGINFQTNFRISRATKIRASFAYLELALQLKRYNTAYTILGYEKDLFTFFRLGWGLTKGIQLTRNVELRPYSAIGFEYTGHSEIPEKYSVGGFYFKPGANICINITHNIQLTGGWGYYYIMGWFKDENEKTVVPWEDVFPDRKGESYSVGIKHVF